jgi:hypothetical protein
MFLLHFKLLVTEFTKSIRLCYSNKQNVSQLKKYPLSYKIDISIQMQDKNISIVLSGKFDMCKSRYHLNVAENA